MAVLKERVPFEFAISDPKLLKPRFDTLSVPQQTVLKAFYGLDLSDEELEAWFVLQESCTYDELGFVTSVTPIPYLKKEYDTLVGIIGRRAGKALALDTPIPTPNGWTTMGDIAVGDVLFDETGCPTRVTFVTDVQHNRPCYCVTFSDGHTLIADADHQWFAWDKASRKAIREPYRKARARVVTTGKMAHKPLAGKESNWAITLGGPVQYPFQQLPLDPYLFGTWLGDGHTHNARITTADADIRDAWANSPWQIRQHPDDPITYSVNGGLRGVLRELNVLKNKHIPDVYLHSSVDQRIALLQGLLDTDGYVTPKGCEFYNTNERLAFQVKELVESLGLRATLRQREAMLNGKACGQVYTVDFQAPFVVFRLERKANRQRVLERDKPRFRYITAIEQVESVPVRCLQVDSPSHLFLAGKGFIPTHNTDRILATANAYEILLGGHTAYISETEKTKQEVAVFFVAQDVDNAKRNMPFITQAVEMSPLLRKELVGEPTKEVIRFKNGINVYAEPSTITSSRGLAIPVADFDEVGFWYTDAKSANPDFEVERAVDYAMMQFPFAKKFIITTPWTREGLAWKYYQAGTEGRKLLCTPCRAANAPWCRHQTEAKEEYAGVLVVHASTAAMKNPLMTRKKLSRLQKKDPDAFIRESLARFVDSVSNFIPAALVHDATEPGITVRPPLSLGSGYRPTYVAAMDPAFRNDSFAFSVVHQDSERGIVQDVLHEWVPTPGDPLNPAVILDEISAYLKAYGISLVYSDQYQLESLQQLALDRNFSIIGVDFTASSKARILGSFVNLLRLRRCKLLDIPVIRQQLTQLEKKRTAQGTIQISAPVGKHDDVAMVTALSVHQSLWLLAQAPAKEEEKNLFQRGKEVIERHKREMETMYD